MDKRKKIITPRKKFFVSKEQTIVILDRSKRACREYGIVPGQKFIDCAGREGIYIGVGEINPEFCGDDKKNQKVIWVSFVEFNGEINFYSIENFNFFNLKNID